MFTVFVRTFLCSFQINKSELKLSIMLFWDIVEVILTFFGLSSTGVILDGSTMGLGLRRFSIKLCHCVGRPTKTPRFASNDVWTRCSKFFGAEISGLFFFFLRNIVRYYSRELSKHRNMKNIRSHFTWTIYILCILMH